ncbi:unnamed protein product [Diutina catenulata]
MPSFEVERSAMSDDNVILNQNHVGNAIEFSMRQIGESISKLHGELEGCNEWIEHYNTKLNNSGEHPLDNQRQNRRNLQDKIAKVQNRLEYAGEEKDRKECQHIINESQAKISTLDISIANAEYAEENAREYEETLEKCKDIRAEAKALLEQFKVAAGVEPYKLDDTKGVFVFSTSQFQNMCDATLARIPRDILTAEELRAYRMNDPEDLFGQVIELFDDCEIRDFDLSKDLSFEAEERWTESEELGRIRITSGNTRPAVHGYAILEGHRQFRSAYAFAKGHLGEDARVDILEHYESTVLSSSETMVPKAYALVSYSFDTNGPRKTRYHAGGESTTFTPITQSEASCSYCHQRGHTINQCLKPCRNCSQRHYSRQRCTKVNCYSCQANHYNKSCREWKAEQEKKREEEERSRQTPSLASPPSQGHKRPRTAGTPTNEEVHPSDRPKANPWILVGGKPSGSPNKDRNQGSNTLSPRIDHNQSTQMSRNAAQTSPSGTTDGDSDPTRSASMTDTPLSPHQSNYASTLLPDTDSSDPIIALTTAMGTTADNTSRRY